MPFDREERRAALRAEDPIGQRSNNEIDDQVEIESLHFRINQLPDFGELQPIKEILSDIVGRIEMRRYGK